MSIVLTEVGQERRKAEAFFGEGDKKGEPLTFFYDPSKYTPLLEQRVNDAFDKKMLGSMYAGMLDGVILEWDAKDIHPEDKEKIAAGKMDRTKARLVPFPPTTENLALVPIGALVKIVEAMQGDNRPKPTASDNSSGSFDTAEK